jgi:hypothetical protein
MAGTNFRSASEFDPETYDGRNASGLLGRLLAIVQPSQNLPGNNSGSNPIGAAQFDPRDYDGPQGGLLGRLRALQAQQSQYQPTPGNDGQTQNPDFRQVSPRPSASGAGSPASPEASTFDPLDITKSLGIGVADGFVNAAGFPADALMGFGYLPDHFVENPLRRMLGYPNLPADTPCLMESAKSNQLRNFAEKNFGAFYQPKSRAGRYAETIGEMVPMVLGGEGAGVGLVRLGGGRLAAHDTLRELPWTLTEHAVAPGVTVQALEEALPESKLGPTLQNIYPAVRWAAPVALAATRHLSRRLAP